MATKRDAERYAARLGCALSADYTGLSGGWDVELHAPDGMVFNHSNCGIDRDIPGNGLLRSEIDWEAVIEAIRVSAACGFSEADE